MQSLRNTQYKFCNYMGATSLMIVCLLKFHRSGHSIEDSNAAFIKTPQCTKRCDQQRLEPSPTRQHVQFCLPTRKSPIAGPVGPWDLAPSMRHKSAIQMHLISLSRRSLPINQPDVLVPTLKAVGSKLVSCLSNRYVVGFATGPISRRGFGGTEYGRIVQWRPRRVTKGTLNPYRTPYSHHIGVECSAEFLETPCRGFIKETQSLFSRYL